MAVNNLFLPKTKKSAKHKVSFHFSIPKSGCIGLQVEVDYLFQPKPNTILPNVKHLQLFSVEKRQYKVAL